jgi:hypothetical protein
MMSLKKSGMLLTLLGILFAFLFVFRLLNSQEQQLRRLREGVRLDEAVFSALSNSFASACANRDRHRLQCYYAFKEIEVGDQQAWDVACRQVAEELAGLSNSLHLASIRLASRKAKLAAMGQTPDHRAMQSAPKTNSQ